MKKRQIPTLSKQTKSRMLFYNENFKCLIKAGWGDSNKRVVYYLDTFPNEMYHQNKGDKQMLKFTLTTNKQDIEFTINPSYDELENALTHNLDQNENIKHQ